MFDPSIDAHRECRLIGIGVAIDHQWKIELIQSHPLHGQTDEPPGLGRHEVDRLRCGELRCTDEIAFVFTLFVVHHHNTGTVADSGECFRDGIETDRIVRLMR